MITAEEQRAHRRLWVATLREESFLQGRGWLRKRDTRIDDLDRYCCLGVGCEVYQQETGLGEWKEHRINERVMSYLFVTPEMNSPITLPDPVKEWYGLRMSNGEFLGAFEEEGGRSLSARNDIGSQPFLLIADIIEAEPPGLIVTS